MSVRVRMAPSPTGILHIGGVRTFLFNWLYARGRGGECLLRMESRSRGLEDVVILRSDGRPTYNFASPVEDWLDGITRVSRGADHVSNTPKQINVLRALSADLPVYAHA